MRVKEPGDTINRYHIRVELNAARSYLLVGTTRGNSPGMLRQHAIWEVPVSLVRTAEELAAVVDSYAAAESTSKICDLSQGLQARYKLNPGDRINGKITTP